MIRLAAAARAEQGERVALLWVGEDGVEGADEVVAADEDFDAAGGAEGLGEERVGHGVGGFGIGLGAQLVQLFLPDGLQRGERGATFLRFRR